MTIKQLLIRLRTCPKGNTGWSDFEDVCIDILRYLFVPPLQEPKIQRRTYKKTIRRDALFPNRNVDNTKPWGHLFMEFGARMVLFEFKNYHSNDLTGTAVEQACGYLTNTTGRLGVIISTKPPTTSAIARRSMFFNDQKKLVLFLTPNHLREMIRRKRGGEDPADLVMDLVEDFYAEHQ